ncbi:carbon-nitrogen hydrolase [Candidatus Endobugula sertula]|uniref:Omega-amidase YafV n=1 Tax=Candidatus Endobugula sertula TaxID=62101 RepID=A0A1D2QU58_9GAMM|nr:carbon-nitrogen hydrolase [Candidatus Endobugula sertula]
MNNLRVSLVQPDLVWLDPQANLSHLASLMAGLSGSVDLIVLPEMFTSGFTEKPESLSGNQYTVEWMLKQSQQLNAAIAGSLAFEGTPDDIGAINKRYVNRLVFVSPSGDVSHYDKAHLFRMGREHERYQAGSKRRVVDYRGWRLLLTVCYDLRFPVFCRNCNDYDAMLCVANWPTSRRHVWRTLLQARAIENQAYVIGVNRVGVDGRQLEYSGDSMAVDVQGHILVDGGDGCESVLAAELSADNLRHAREVFPVWKDADSFQLI